MAQQQQSASKQIVLLVIDGWGIAPTSESNPTTGESLPHFEQLFCESLQTRLWAHGEYVGLLKDQDGNSEAGHLNLGAGRVVKQDSVIVSEAIRDRTFFKNPAFAEAIQHVKRNDSNIHIMGLLSDGQSAHSTPEHLYALLDMMDREKIKRVYVHLFSDGRDSLWQAGKGLYQKVVEKLHPNQQVATVIGRFYAMDRKKEWSRTERAYNALVLGEGAVFEDLSQAFDQAYEAGMSDEFIEPCVASKNGKPVAMVQDNDSIIYFNHRSDRARQLTKAFTQPDFTDLNPGSFKLKKRVANLRFVAMTDFGPDLGNILTAYPSVDVEQALPKVLSKKKQIYIAETEKYAHMTYFFNGGYADPVGNEERAMVPSPKVARYDEAPGMSTGLITDTVIRCLTKGGYDFVAANFACLDMVAHTGNFAAAKQALHAVDEQIGRIMIAVRSCGAILMVTADHGNIEEMKDLSSKSIDTEHSKNQVPFLLWNAGSQYTKLRAEGLLGDVAPTIIGLFGLRVPEQMTGTSLIVR